MTAMPAKDTATSLAYARVAFGAAALLAPRVVLKLSFLGSAEGTEKGAYLMRLFGARDLALGALTLLSGPQTRPTLLKVGIAVDASDAVAGALLTRSGAVPAPVGVALTGAGASAVAAGAVALTQRS